MSNKQQQNVVPTVVQSASPPAASALHQKANDDAQGNSQPVGAILMLEYSNLPPTTDSILHHSRRGEGVSFVKILGILLEHVH